MSEVSINRELLRNLVTDLVVFHGVAHSSQDCRECRIQANISRAKGLMLRAPQ